MTGLVVLAFVPFIVAIAFMIRSRAERLARDAAEQDASRLRQRVLDLEATSPASASDVREWLAVLGHELRSPTAAILGYGELVHEGTLGPVDPRAADAIERICIAAGQLVSLLDGLDAAVEPAAAGDHNVSGGADDAQSCSAADLLGAAAAALRFEADARNVRITVEPAAVELHTIVEDAQRAVILALGAAVKVSPGDTLRLSAVEGTVPALIIDDSKLDSAVDRPAGIGVALGSRTRAPVASSASATGPGATGASLTGASLTGTGLTGAAFRLALADAMARRAGGSVALEPHEPRGQHARIVLRFPRGGAGPSR